MDLVARVQGLILKPKEEWVKIKGEDTPPTKLMMTYAAILALIPAIAQFIGQGLIGYRYFGIVARRSIAGALIYAILYYLFMLAMIYGFGLIINALAPNFGSKQNLQKAMQLSVYSMTVPLVAGIFYILPSLGVLASLAGLYGLYVLYLGFNTPMMETPKDKVISYIVVCMVAVVVLFVVVTVLMGIFFVSGSVASFGIH
jgi:hypothetical protein